jgi:hypothetical protein
VSIGAERDGIYAGRDRVVRGALESALPRWSVVGGGERGALVGAHNFCRIRLSTSPIQAGNLPDPSNTSRNISTKDSAHSIKRIL